MITAGAETGRQRFWKGVDALGRFLRRIIGISIVALVVLDFGGASFRYFRRIGWPQSLLEVAATVIGLAVLYWVRRPLGRFAKRLTIITLRCLYYAAATVFYASAVATALSLLSIIGNGLTSFLTAPIGIKAATEATGLGAFFLPLVLSTAVSGLFYAVGRNLKDEVRTLLTATTPNADSEASTVQTTV